MVFSIVLATYNRRALLSECLSALFNQTFPHDQYEVIVVDNGSTDGTIEYLQQLESQTLAERYNVAFSFFRLKDNPGPAVARNRGIKVAEGEFVAMTDDDCVPPLNWLERLKDGFDRYIDVVGVSGYQEAPPRVLSKNPIAKFERYQTRAVYGAKDLEIVGGWESPAGVTNNVAFKRNVLLEVGGFDESFPVPAGEDADLKKRITDRGYQLAYLPIRVEHRQEYSLRRFLRQQYVRGIGGRHFRSKWEGYDTINWLMLVKSFPKFFITLLTTGSFTFACLEFLGKWWMVYGELKGGAVTT